LRQLFAKPRRVVELTAGAPGPTVFPIPESIILIEMMIVDESDRVARLTEVVTSHPGGDGYGNSVEAVSAWAGDGSIQLFRRSSCKGPDVLSRVSVGDQIGFQYRGHTLHSE